MPINRILLRAGLFISLFVLTSLAVGAEPTKPMTPAEAARLVNIPFKQFTLKNGLRVVVHTDRKAPVVAVSVWYGVGSKHEPKGKTGFAHLFEHLMFNGSENAPGDYFEPLQQVGATDFNGTTWLDRTNYFETVPTGALERALFLESDRMGHLLGAVTQDKLDNQRGVVQNEKRQGDNQPYGLVRYATFESLFPKGHPYHHSTIGSMADLNAASLTDVKKWFSDNYGPNNAVLVLAGDVDVATAKTLVDKYFGDIKRGPSVHKVTVPVPTLDAPKMEVMKDRVATTRVYRMWAIPGLNHKDAAALEAAASVLGGLSSSRLDNTLVRSEKIAVSVTAGTQLFQHAGVFSVSADVKPGEDKAKVAARLDAVIAEFMAQGPTQDELDRASTRAISFLIRGYESVGGFGGKATALAEGLLYSGDPSFYKKRLTNWGTLTPSGVKAVINKYLSRPVYSLIVEPGERTETGAERGGAVSEQFRPYFFRDVLSDESSLGMTTSVDRSKLPDVGSLARLDFPSIERAKLSNGIDVVFARRTSIPTVQLSLSFDAGYASDPKDALGTQSLMLNLLEEGTKSRTSVQIAEESERLGAFISAGATFDRTGLTLDALTPNLRASLELFADIVRNPSFNPAEVERLRAQQLSAIAQELNNPNAIGTRVLFPILYGEEHPYGIPPSGSGDPKVVARVSREELAAFHTKWLRPDTATIVAAGNTTLTELMPLLEKSFGDWQAPSEPKPAKSFKAKIPSPKQRIVLVDRPKSPQSVIVAAHVLNATARDALETLNSANDVLGGNFLSRINMNLRETKGWSYGARSQVNSYLESASFIVRAPVQADKTGPSISEILNDVTAFLGDKGVTAEELERTINGSTRELPGSFERTGPVLEAMQRIIFLGRPDDYYETLADKYRAMTVDSLNQEARSKLDPKKLVFVVVGDASVVKPQLESLGMPIEVIPAPEMK